MITEQPCSSCVYSAVLHTEVARGKMGQVVRCTSSLKPDDVECSNTPMIRDCFLAKDYSPKPKAVDDEPFVHIPRE